ncbi:MAG: T9SS type A sorting domain-containing protein [Bacteroidales bacterium]|nr:T9SS type A sorting domain-containing protein [Bacteroidales bacterium]
MRDQKIQFTFLLFLVFGVTGLRAQEAQPATGGEASGSGGSVSYSVGQVVYTTVSGSSASSNQGIQQPYEIVVETALDEAKGIELNVLAYPNPVQNFLVLKITNYLVSVGDLALNDLFCQLYDVNGNMLKRVRIKSSETRIAMNRFIPAIYFLKVLRDEREIKTFKIIKH